MYIKHFTPFARRVPDPLRPGRTAVVEELRSSEASEFSYTGSDGKEVTVSPNKDGWFDVPQDIGVRVCKFRAPGGFYTPAEVDEQVRLGAIDDPPPKPRPRKSED